MSIIRNASTIEVPWTSQPKIQIGLKERYSNAAVLTPYSRHNLISVLYNSNYFNSTVNEDDSGYLQRKGADYNSAIDVQISIKATKSGSVLLVPSKKNIICNGNDIYLNGSSYIKGDGSLVIAASTRIAAAAAVNKPMFFHTENSRYIRVIGNVIDENLNGSYGYWQFISLLFSVSIVNKFSMIAFFPDIHFEKEEMLSLTANPWQIFQPRKVQLPLDFYRGPQEPRRSYFLGTNTKHVNEQPTLKPVFTSQPQCAVQIDWSNPLTKDLLEVWNGSSLIPIKTNIVKYNITDKFKENNLALGSYSTKSVLGSTGKTIFKPPMTMFSVVNHIVTLPSDYYTIAQIGASGPPGRDGCGFYNTQYEYFYSLYSAWSGFNLNINVTPQVNSRVTCIGRSFSNVSHEFKLLIGKQEYVKTSTFDTSSLLFQTLSPCRFGKNGYNSTEVFYLFNRALSDSEVKSLSANPWQIFKPLTRHLPLPATQVVQPRPTTVRVNEPLPVFKPEWNSQPQATGLTIANTRLANNIYAALIPLRKGWLDIVSGKYIPNTNTNNAEIITPFGKSVASPISQSAESFTVNHNSSRTCNSVAVSLYSQNDSWGYQGSFAESSSFGNSIGFNGNVFSFIRYWIAYRSLSVQANKLYNFVASFDNTHTNTCVNGDIQKFTHAPYGNLYGSKFTTTSHSVLVVVYWNRMISDEEMKSFCNNPWQIFSPLPRQLPLLVDKSQKPYISLVKQQKMYWKSQPQYPAGIDWSNPITRGLVSALPSLFRKDEANPLNGTPTIVGSVEKTAGAQGISATFNSSYVNYLAHYVNGCPDGKGYTLIALAEISGYGNANHLIDADANPPRIFQFRTEASGVLTAIPFNTAGSAFSVSSSIVVPVNTPVVVAMTVESVANTWVNGIKGPSSSSITGTIKGIGSNQIRIGSRPNNGGGGFLGKIYGVLIFNRVLGDSELRAISANPWQIFKPLTYQQWGGTD